MNQGQPGLHSETLLHRKYRRTDRRRTEVGEEEENGENEGKEGGGREKDGGREGIKRSYPFGLAMPHSWGRAGTQRRPAPPSARAQSTAMSPATKRPVRPTMCACARMGCCAVLQVSRACCKGTLSH